MLDLIRWMGTGLAKVHMLLLQVVLYLAMVELLGPYTYPKLILKINISQTLQIMSVNMVSYCYGMSTRLPPSPALF